MIDLSGNKFSTQPFIDKTGLCYRFSALKKLQEDAEMGMGVTLELLPYLELKQLPLETIHIYFQMFVSDYSDAYKNFVEQQSSL